MTLGDVSATVGCETRPGARFVTICHRADHSERQLAQPSRPHTVVVLKRPDVPPQERLLDTRSFQRTIRPIRNGPSRARPGECLAVLARSWRRPIVPGSIIDGASWLVPAGPSSLLWPLPRSGDRSRRDEVGTSAISRWSGPRRPDGRGIRMATRVGVPDDQGAVARPPRSARTVRRWNAPKYGRRPPRVTAWVPSNRPDASAPLLRGDSALARMRGGRTGRADHRSSVTSGRSERRRNEHGQAHALFRQCGGRRRPASPRLGRG